MGIGILDGTDAGVPSVSHLPLCVRSPCPSASAARAELFDSGKSAVLAPGERQATHLFKTTMYDPGKSVVYRSYSLAMCCCTVPVFDPTVKPSQSGREVAKQVLVYLLTGNLQRIKV